MNYRSLFCFVLIFLTACSQEKSDITSIPSIKKQLQNLSAMLTEAEQKDDLDGFLKHYSADVISMPEYQPTLQGIAEVKTYYEEIFRRQRVGMLQREIEEVIDFGKTIVEIGTFEKQYSDSESDTLLMQKGKYWNVWEVMPDDSFKLKGEAYGFFHPVKDPQTLVVEFPKAQLTSSQTYLDQKTPFELQAYNALMEKGVRERDGILRSTFFTDDARFMPFSDSTKTGIDDIKPYLIAYNSGKVTIDSISIYTCYSEYFSDDILEYTKFYVKWTVPQFSGTAEGKGIRLWKRQEDKSLRLYREIGLHNHLQ